MLLFDLTIGVYSTWNNDIIMCLTYNTTELFCLCVNSDCIKVALVKCELSQLILESTQEKLVRGLTWIRKMRSFGWILKLL